MREVWEETAEIDYLEEKYREFNRVLGASSSRQRVPLIQAPCRLDFRYSQT